MNFRGACIDTEATKTVIGRPQALEYARMIDTEYSPAPASSRRFLFGGAIHPSLGTIAINFLMDSEMYTTVDVDIVAIDVPFLFGLQQLDDLGLYVNNVETRLKCDKRGIATPLVPKDIHIYLEWGDVVHYTTTDLGRLHQHFAHPPAERLAAILKRAGDPSLAPKTRAQLIEVTRRCDICQRLACQPGRFRVTMPPDEIMFNRTLLMDGMLLDQGPVLLVVDKYTTISAACFLKGETNEAIWAA